MDPAENERLREALAAQGVMIGQHDRALQRVMEAIRDLTAGVTNIGGRMEQVAAHLSTLPPTADAQATDPAPPPQADPERQRCNPREPFIPTSVRYSGDVGSCSQFLHQCSLVFEQQPFTYSTDRTRVAFIMSLLSDKAAAWALAISNSNSPISQSLSSFTAEMRRVFDHPVRGKEAGKRLLSLHQGSGSVADFAIDFRILAAESGWGDMALLGIFYKGLKDELKDELAVRDETSSLEELISLAIRLDNRLRERRRERSGKHSSTSFPPPSKFPSRPAFSGPSRHPPDSGPPRPSPDTQVSPFFMEEPMQLGRMTLTPSERQRRLRQRLCFYCGQAGHVSAGCPSLPKDMAHQRQGEH